MRRCLFCRGEIPDGSRADTVFCKKLCRQSAFRLRRRRATNAAGDRPMKMAYADPPYPGSAYRYYRKEENYAGEVDHPALIAKLERDYPDGWALSTSAAALRHILPLCPPEAHLCPWVKPRGIGDSFGLSNAWEALIVVRGRQQKPGVRDFLVAHAARGGGTLPGRKPLAFCAFLFDALGLGPGDTLDDLFPGTGIIGRAWAACSEPSPLEERRVVEVLSTAPVAGPPETCRPLQVATRRP